MRKIASPQELQTELRRLLAYAQSEKPSREKLAENLRALADAVEPKLAVGFSPEETALVEGLQKEAQRMAPRWKLPAGFKEVYLKPNLRGVSFQLIREGRGFLPFWATYDQPNIEITDSNHRTVKLPMDTPPAEVLKKLWSMQIRALR